MALLTLDPTLVHLRDAHGRTPLHFAARANCVLLLRDIQLGGGAMTCLDVGGRSPLLYAVRRAAVDALEWLLSAGAPVGGPPDKHGLSALHHAVLAQSPRCVRALLAAGASVHAKDLLGNSAYMLAAEVAAPSGLGANLSTERQWEVLALLKGAADAAAAAAGGGAGGSAAGR